MKTTTRTIFLSLLMCSFACAAPKSSVDSVQAPSSNSILNGNVASVPPAAATALPNITQPSLPLTDANNKLIIPDSNQVMQLVAGPVVQTRPYTLFYGRVPSPTGEKLVVNASTDANFCSGLIYNGMNNSVGTNGLKPYSLNTFVVIAAPTVNLIHIGVPIYQNIQYPAESYVEGHACGSSYFSEPNASRQSSGFLTVSVPPTANTPITVQITTTVGTNNLIFDGDAVYCDQMSQYLNFDPPHADSPGTYRIGCAGFPVR